MNLQVAGKLNNSLTNGKGMRYVLFLSGCPHKCKGCQNPHTWDYSYGDSIDIKDILNDIKSGIPIIHGVTFSGGEPFEQSKTLIELAKGIIKLGLNIWIYTGYTYETLKDKNDKYINELLNYADVLVDGPFIKELKDEGLKYRGSSNQRIINLLADWGRGK